LDPTTPEPTSRSGAHPGVFGDQVIPFSVPSKQVKIPCKSGIFEIAKGGIKMEGNWSTDQLVE
jgi:hypothetical protein